MQMSSPDTTLEQIQKLQQLTDDIAQWLDQTSAPTTEKALEMITLLTGLLEQVRHIRQEVAVPGYPPRVAPRV